METDDIRSQLDWHKFNVERTDGFWRAAYEGANASGRNAVNSILLGSGGAVVALLAFLGNLLSKDTAHDYVAQTHVTAIVHGIARALVPFAGSMFFAMVTAALTYLAMFAFAGGAADEPGAKRDRLIKIGVGFNWAAIAFGVISLGLFGYGACVGIAMLKSI